MTGVRPEAGAQPNVVLISLDTLRADHVSAYGYGRETTPNLDALAERSWLFENCYSGAPWTLASHMTMLTGLYADQHQVVGGQRALSPELPLLAERFSEVGYQTSALFFEGWIHERHGFARGFDRFEKHPNAGAATRNLEAILDERDGRPWFLFLHVFDIHSGGISPDTRLVYSPPPKMRDRFLPGAADHFERGDGARLWHGTREPTAEDLEALIALYDAGIYYVDGRLGQWLSLLEGEGVLENGVLAVTSDHGESLGQRQGHLPDHGGLFEEGLRVPLVVHRGDGEFSPQRVSRYVHHVDLAPSLLELCGLEVPGYLPGVSLFASEVPGERVFSAIFQKDTARLAPPLKYVKADHPKRTDTLVDLSVDPLELSPLGPGDEGFAESAAELERAFARQFEGRSIPGSGPIGILKTMDEAELERMRALGYAESIEDAAQGAAPGTSESEPSSTDG